MRQNRPKPVSQWLSLMKFDKINVYGMTRKVLSHLRHGLPWWSDENVTEHHGPGSRSVHSTGFWSFSSEHALVVVDFGKVSHQMLQGCFMYRVHLFHEAHDTRCSLSCKTEKNKFGQSSLEQPSSWTHSQNSRVAQRR